MLQGDHGPVAFRNIKVRPAASSRSLTGGRCSVPLSPRFGGEGLGVRGESLRGEVTAFRPEPYPPHPNPLPPKRGERE